MIGFGMMTLQQLRLDKGYTLAELAELSGLSLGRIGNWEAWSRDPRPKTARDPLLMSVQSALRLSSALDVSLDVLAECLTSDASRQQTNRASAVRALVVWPTFSKCRRGPGRRPVLRQRSRDRVFYGNVRHNETHCHVLQKKETKHENRAESYEKLLKQSFKTACSRGIS